MTPRRALLAAAAIALACAAAAPAFAADADARFDRTSARVLEEFLRRRPQLATRLGRHDLDAVLLPVTPASVASDLEWIARARAELAAIPAEALSPDRAVDARILGARLERERLQLAEIRSWARDPSSYLDLVAGAIQSVLQSEAGSPCARVVRATRRLRVVPEILRAARLQLQDPPRIYTEIAIGQFDGALRFYRVTIGELTADCRDPGLQAALAEADTQAVRATEEFLGALRGEILARSTGSFALGRELYAKKLAAEEFETADPDTLLALGVREFERLEARLAELAARIAPGGDVAAALDSVERDAPTEAELVPFVASLLDSIRDFVVARDLVTPPARQKIVVRETPLFRRGLSFASLESAGPWERGSVRAFYNVTPPEAGWTAAQRHDHLRFFNRWAAANVTIHEAIPGHAWDALARRELRSRIRQAFPCASATEGWAHYCEQMTVEAGFGGGDPRAEFAQQLAALRRVGRFVVGLSLHTRGMSVEEAQALFESRCRMSPVTAAREARRGAADPTYLVYTLGKWRILELRDEVRRTLGPGVSPRAFHDALLRRSGVALPLVRDEILRELAATKPR